MNRIDFKMVKDGNRTVIVIDGATAERDAAALQLLQLYAGLEPAEQSDTIAQVEHLEPVPRQDDIPDEKTVATLPSFADIAKCGKLISNGTYKDMTAAQALNVDKSKALAELFAYARGIPQSAEKDDIVASCKQWMYDLPAMRSEYPNRKSRVEFLVNIAPMMAVGAFCTAYGYPDFKSFCDYATDLEVNNVFINVTNALQQRSEGSAG